MTPTVAILSVTSAIGWLLVVLQRVTLWRERVELHSLRTSHAVLRAELGAASEAMAILAREPRPRSTPAGAA